MAANFETEFANLWKTVKDQQPRRSVSSLTLIKEVSTFGAAQKNQTSFNTINTIFFVQIILFWCSPAILIVLNDAFRQKESSR